MIRRLALAALAALALFPAAASAQVITSTPPSCAKAGANTVTANAPVLDCTQTWSNAGVTFYGFRLNVTNTASASGSLLMDLQVAGTSTFSVDKSGTALAASAVGAPNAVRATSNGGVFTLGSSLDVVLARDAANTLALRNGASAQTFRVYNTYTDASNGEWGVADWNISTNIFYVGTRQNGTGVARDFGLMSGGNSRWLVKAGGDFYAALDNTYDIGASGANRPRNVYVGTNVIAGSSVAAGAGGLLQWASRSVMASPADGNVTLQNAAQTSFGLLQFGGTTASFPALKRNGTGVDFRVADDSAWSAVNAGVFIAKNAYIQTAVTTVASLTACNAGLEGARQGVTDATATTFLSAVVGGGANHVPVYCDGTSWKIG